MSLPEYAILLLSLMDLVHVWRSRWRQHAKWEQMMKEDK